MSGAINLLFSQSLESRLKMYVSNPLHAPPVPLDIGEEEGNRNGGIVDTPNITVLANKAWPISSSTPFQHPSEDSTLYETTAFSMERPSVTITGLDQSPADMVVKNPLFSSGLKLSKVRKWINKPTGLSSECNNVKIGMDNKSVILVTQGSVDLSKLRIHICCKLPSKQMYGKCIHA